LLENLETLRIKKKGIFGGFFDDLEEKMFYFLCHFA